MEKYNRMYELFKSGGGVLTTGELEEAGISYYFIKKLMRSNEIERIKQGVYRWLEGSNDEWAEVKKIVPQGVFCLFSAAALHELSTFVSSEYHVAIPWKSKVTLPHYPPIQLYFWKDNQYHIGQVDYKNDALDLVLYDLEKTVCDFVKFRRKVGLDITKEVIRNYLNRKDRNLDKLMAYSRQLKISSVVKRYIEVLV